MIAMQGDHLQSALERFTRRAIATILKHESWPRLWDWMQAELPDTGIVPREIAADPALVRALSFALGRALWNAVPLPGNGMRPRPLPMPGRNDRCPCGAVAKWKRCCGRFDMPVLPTFDPLEMHQLVLETLPARRRGEIAADAAVPLAAVVEAAFAEFDAARPQRVVQLLEPRFVALPSGPAPARCAAFELLCDSYDRLGHHRKLRSFAARIAEQTEQPDLRPIALRHLADAQLVEQDFAGAAGSLAGIARPLEVPGASHVAVKIAICTETLAAAHRLAEQRMAELRRRGGEREQGEAAAIADLLATAEARHPETLCRTLATALAGIGDRPLPVYRLDIDAVDTMPLAERLRSMGVDPAQAPLSAPPAAGEADPRKDDGDAPFGITPPEALRTVELHWREAFPDQKPLGTHAAPRGERRALQPDAVTRWCGFLHSEPAALDSLDVLDDVAGVLAELPTAHGLLRTVLERAAAIVAAAMAGRSVELPWTNVVNRVALRPFARLFRWHLERGEDTAAAPIADILLRWNPVDNHGMRSFVVNRLLRRSDDAAALSLAQRYPDDTVADTVFGAVLALYRLGLRDQAAARLRQGRTSRSHVPHYLVAARVRKPRLDPSFVTVGGADQAWLYRQQMRPEWQRSKGALEWLASECSGRARDAANS